MKMQNLKLAVVGPGLIGQKHIELIATSDGVELNSIVAPNNPINRQIAETWQVQMHSSIEECLSSQTVDGVIISSPNEFHFTQASKCIEAGIPILIEKPITVSVHEGRALVKLAHANNAKVLVGHHRAYSPLLTAAKTAIESGRLGKLVSVLGSAQFYKPSQYFIDGPWRTKPGGGPILINMIHEIGNLRALIGEISSVQAIASHHARSFDVEDTVAINLLFDNGVLGTFMLSDAAATPKSWEQTSGENPSYPNYQDEDCYTITGTKGTLSIPTMRLRYYAEDLDKSWWTPFCEEVLPVKKIDPLKCQLEHFINVIKGAEMPLVSEVDGLRNLLGVEAIRNAIKTGATVKLGDSSYGKSSVG
jgi:predicted dehydrogenase